MKIIHTRGFSKLEQVNYQRIIHANLISCMQILIEESKKLKLSKFNSELKEIIKEIGMIDKEATITDGFGGKIQKLWESENIQKTYEKYETYHLPDSTNYFFQKIDEICQKDYVPTDEDILLCRSQTTGVIQIQFESHGHNFTIIDVGGQRNERRKWITHFEGVTAVLFVTSLSGYNQVLYEDEEVNRMEESLTLFFEQCNSRWFNDVPFILFLNKLDLFEKKLSVYPLKDLFQEYDGGDNLENAKEFIKQKFLEKSKNKQKTIYTHFTTATNTKNVKVVFAMVQDIILNKMLPEIGYL
ncbi:guanine nucleotide-binding protein g(o) subunit alpha [Anaeramoeba flamelloides]|uniref:Guanine nucleotide-binding protein g(O) subunit alpha n=1 Tax=Anaeramoeba flamelloides TaxID=1746091 RepID=A0ABQ8YP65_9EUKA|nr:guanine nucleotide-binding protein g(o) subunit alpha [Anaeramoeba flamelloides]